MSTSVDDYEYVSCYNDVIYSRYHVMNKAFSVKCEKLVHGDMCMLLNMDGMQVDVWSLVYM